MSNLQKVIKGGGDVREQIPEIFQDEFTADVAEKYIPMVEQTTDSNGNIIPAITGIMSREEKVNTLMDHIEAGSVDSNTLLLFAKNTLDEGAQSVGAGYKLLKAYGGLEDVLGPTDPSLDKSITHTNRNIIRNDDGKLQAPDSDKDGVPDYLDPDSGNQSRVAEIQALPAGEQREVTAVGEKLIKYDNLDSSEKAKLKQLKKQATKKNYYLSKLSDREFYNAITTPETRPKTPGLDKFLKMISTPPDYATFTGTPYSDLSEENKKRIKQYKISGKSGNKYLVRLSDRRFYESLSQEELNKILK